MAGGQHTTIHNNIIFSPSGYDSDKHLPVSRTHSNTKRSTVADDSSYIPSGAGSPVAVTLYSNRDAGNPNDSVQKGVSRSSSSKKF